MFKITAIGNLGRNAKQQASQKGQFISMSIGCSNGEQTIWVDATMNGEREKLMPYLTKGQQVYIEGNAIVGTYTDGNGKAQCFVKCAVSNLQLCGKADERQQQEQQQPQAQYPQYQQQQQWQQPQQYQQQPQQYQRQPQQNQQQFNQGWYGQQSTQAGSNTQPYHNEAPF